MAHIVSQKEANRRKRQLGGQSGFHAQTQGAPLSEGEKRWLAIALKMLETTVPHADEHGEIEGIRAKNGILEE